MANTSDHDLGTKTGREAFIREIMLDNQRHHKQTGLALAVLGQFAAESGKTLSVTKIGDGSWAVRMDDAVLSVGAELHTVAWAAYEAHGDPILEEPARPVPPPDDQRCEVVMGAEYDYDGVCTKKGTRCPLPKFHWKPAAKVEAGEAPPATGRYDSGTPCFDNAPPGYKGHWRDWHRGHGCTKDPDAKRGAGEALQPSPAPAEPAQHHCTCSVGGKCCMPCVACGTVIPDPRQPAEPALCGKPCTWASNPDKSACGNPCAWKEGHRGREHACLLSKELGDAPPEPPANIEEPSVEALIVKAASKHGRVSIAAGGLGWYVETYERTCSATTVRGALVALLEAERLRGAP